MVARPQRPDDLNAQEGVMSFDPYLHFQGNCAEAMAFYAKVFGTEVAFMMRYRDMPEAVGPMAESDLVMHAALSVNGRVLMASDFPPGMAGDPQQAVSVSHSEPDFDSGRRIFEALLEGGDEIMAYQPTFWAQGFGMLKDRFGTHWMVSGPSTQTQTCLDA